MLTAQSKKDVVFRVKRNLGLTDQYLCMFFYLLSTPFKVSILSQNTQLDAIRHSPFWQQKHDVFHCKYIPKHCPEQYLFSLLILLVLSLPTSINIFTYISPLTSFRRLNQKLLTKVRVLKSSHHSSNNSSSYQNTCVVQCTNRGCCRTFRVPMYQMEDCMSDHSHWSCPLMHLLLVNHPHPIIYNLPRSLYYL